MQDLFKNLFKICDYCKIWISSVVKFYLNFSRIKILLWWGCTNYIYGLFYLCTICKLISGVSLLMALDVNFLIQHWNGNYHLMLRSLSYTSKDVFAFFWRCTFCLEKVPKNGFQKQKTEMLGNTMSADLVPPDQIIPKCFSTLNSCDISAVLNILLNQDVISLNLTAKAYC